MNPITSEQNAQFNVSKQDWPGLQPQKWSGGRVHIRPQDQLTGIYDQKPLPVKGKKMFEEKFSDKYTYKPHTKQFDGKHGNQTAESEHKFGLKKIQYIPNEKPPRAELKHFGQTNTGHLEDNKYGIQTYEHANQTKGELWNLEDKMTQKKRLEYLEQKRNHLNCHSLGDKSYKYPEYSADFYKGGGLIPGSTIKAKPKKKTTEKTLTSTRVQGKMTWKERVKKDERDEEEDAVGELDDWVENVLKEANPNYQDPDQFFERMEKQEEPKTTKKDTKKGKK